MQTTPLRTSDQRTLLLYIHLNWRVSRILLYKKKSFRITKLYSGFYCRFAPYVKFYLFIIFFWPIISPLCRTRKNFGGEYTQMSSEIYFGVGVEFCSFSTYLKKCSSCMESQHTFLIFYFLKNPLECGWYSILSSLKFSYINKLRTHVLHGTPWKTWKKRKNCTFLIFEERLRCRRTLHCSTIDAYASCASNTLFFFENEVWEDVFDTL